MFKLPMILRSKIFIIFFLRNYTATNLSFKINANESGKPAVLISSIGSGKRFNSMLSYFILSSEKFSYLSSSSKKLSSFINGFLLLINDFLC